MPLAFFSEFVKTGNLVGKRPFHIPIIQRSLQPVLLELLTNMADIATLDCYISVCQTATLFFS